MEEKPKNSPPLLLLPERTDDASLSLKAKPPLLQIEAAESAMRFFPAPASKDRWRTRSVILGGVLLLLFGILWLLGANSRDERLDATHRAQAAPRALVRKTGEAMPPLAASGVMVLRAKTGEIIFEKNADEKFAPASLVKLLTAFMFLESSEPLSTMSISSEAKSVLERDEKRSGISTDDVLKEEDLLKLVVAESDNDAAYAAAERAVLRIRPETGAASFSERIRAFVGAMNAKKDTLDMWASHFTNPAGIDEAGNYTTARDMARLAVRITNDAPLIWMASRMIEGDIYLAGGKTYHFANTNSLLQEFPALLGTKTGLTDAAGGAVVLVYELMPRDPIVAVILKSENRFQDGRTVLNWLDRTFMIQR